jgi:hypothetical protein
MTKYAQNQTKEKKNHPKMSANIMLIRDYIIILHVLETSSLLWNIGSTREQK